MLTFQFHDAMILKRSLLNICTSFTLMLLFNQASAQYAWTQKSDFPGGKRFAAVSFDIDGYGYFGTGADLTPGNSIYYKDLWKYDPNTDTWSQLTDLPGNIRFGATGFSIDQRGYVGLGWVSSTGPALDDFYYYDANTGSWTPMSSFTPGPRYTAIGVNSLNAGYVGFGYSPWFNDMHKLDANTLSWTPMPSCPGAARQSSEGFALDHNVYVGGGSNNQSNTLQDFWEFNTNTQTWTQVADYPHQVYAAVSFVFMGDGFVGCGRTAGTHFNDFFSYNYGTNSWSPVPSLPAMAREHASGFSMGNRAFVMCGRGPGNVYLNDVWELANSTGINDLNAQEVDVKFRGNDQGDLVIDFSSQYDHAYRIRVFDTSGRLLDTISIRGDATETIHIGAPQPVIYHIDRQGVKEVLSGKVMLI